MNASSIFGGKAPGVTHPSQEIIDDDPLNERWAKMKEEEMNIKTNPFKEDMTKDKGEIIKLKHELFNLKQFGMKNKVKSGLGYMLGDNKNDNMSGFEQMLGVNNISNGLGMETKKNMNKSNSKNLNKINKFFNMGMNTKSNDVNMNKFFNMGMNTKSNDMNMNKFFNIGIKNKSNDMNMNKFFNMGTNKSLRNKSIYDSPGNTSMNFKNKTNMFLNMSKNKLKNSDVKIKQFIGNPVQVGMNRMKMQQNLSLWGDKDKDGLMNIYDCDPFDKNKQGGFHDWLEKHKVGQRFSNLVTYGKFNPVEYVNKESAPTTIRERVGGAAKAIGTGLASAYEATGIPEKKRMKQEDIQFRRDIKQSPEFKQAVVQAYSQQEFEKLKSKLPSQKIKMQREEDLSKLKLLQEQAKLDYLRRFSGNYRQPYGSLGTTGSALNTSIGDIRQGLSSTTPYLDNKIYWGFKTGGIGENYPTAVRGLTAFPGQQRYDPFSLKVDELVGSGKLAEEAKRVQASQSQQVSRQYIPQQQPQFNPNIEKYSPYSERSVRYTRGPYKKRKPQVVVVQQPILP